MLHTNLIDTRIGRTRNPFGNIQTIIIFNFVMGLSLKQQNFYFLTKPFG